MSHANSQSQADGDEVRGEGVIRSSRRPGYWSLRYRDDARDRGGRRDGRARVYDERDREDDPREGLMHDLDRSRGESNIRWREPRRKPSAHVGTEGDGLIGEGFV